MRHFIYWNCFYPNWLIEKFESQKLYLTENNQWLRLNFGVECPTRNYDPIRTLLPILDHHVPNEKPKTGILLIQNDVFYVSSIYKIFSQIPYSRKAGKGRGSFPIINIKQRFCPFLFLGRMAEVAECLAHVPWVVSLNPRSQRAEWTLNKIEITLNGTFAGWKTMDQGFRIYFVWNPRLKAIEKASQAPQPIRPGSGQLG